jgi:hypothetical protein
MNRRPRIPITDHLRKAMDDLGAEPLAGSGFEDEAPETGFGTEVQPSESKTSV